MKDANPNDCVILKCETQKSKQELKKGSKIWDMLLSIAITYSYKEDRYRIWTYNNKDELISYLNNKNIIGFNNTKYDLPLVLGESYKCDVTYNIMSVPFKFQSYTVDIFYKILESIYRINTNYDKVNESFNKHPLANMQSFSLYNIYCATSGRSISKDIYDVKSIEMFKSKKILELVEFCQTKLRFVKFIYEHITKYGYILNGDYDVLKLNIKSPEGFTIDDFLPF